MTKLIPAFFALMLLAAPVMAAEETGARAAEPGFSAEGQTLTGEPAAAATPAETGGQTDVPSDAPKPGCTQMWCQEGMTLNLNGTDWPAATYDFVIVLDGKSTRCKATLPFKGCETNVTCNNDNVTIGESGCALQASAHSFNSITSKSSPEKIGFAIRRSDGKFFAWENVVPKICTYPNGSKCDARECCSVYAEVDVTWEDQVPKK